MIKQVIEFEILKPYYATAGDQFNWNDIYGKAGIGFAEKKLKGRASGFIINTDKKGRKIITDVSELYSWWKNNENSYQVIKGTKILVFPLSLFSLINKIDDDEIEQLNLF